MLDYHQSSKAKLGAISGYEQREDGVGDGAAVMRFDVYYATNLERDAILRVADFGIAMVGNITTIAIPV